MFNLFPYDAHPVPAAFADASPSMSRKMIQNPKSSPIVQRKIISNEAASLDPVHLPFSLFRFLAHPNYPNTFSSARTFSSQSKVSSFFLLKFLSSQVRIRPNFPLQIAEIRFSHQTNFVDAGVQGTHCQQQRKPIWRSNCRRQTNSGL